MGIAGNDAEILPKSTRNTTQAIQEHTRSREDTHLAPGVRLEGTFAFSLEQTRRNLRAAHPIQEWENVPGNHPNTSLGNDTLR